MSLQEWANNGWLRPHATSREEISNLLNIVDRDLQDAQESVLSTDWRFGIAYNSALKLCTVLIYCAGYRPERNRSHYRTLQALPLILGPERTDDAAYLDACRNKRNIMEYDYVGGTTESDAKELIDFSKELRADVLKWLKEMLPEFT